MPTVIPVKFKYNARELWFNPMDTNAQEGDHVICTTERGVEMGIATRDPFEVPQAELDDTLGEAPLREVLKVADDDDYARADELAKKSEEAFPIFRHLAKEAHLEMKPVAAEYIFGGDKVVCYFAAEERVDFRQLVRDLSHELHERIDMRQIGVREETALAGGFAHCGQELCCARLGNQFEPVSIRMAKEQDLPLNSTKISGACGRLMCCLRYEFEAYRDFKSRAPKRNAIIDTPLGKAKICEYDTPKEQLCLRLENGKQVRVDLASMTCSAAAKKKSEDTGCKCRPDTVTRSVLERIESPEVQMALAELDRQNGIIPEEELVDKNDIFVSAPRKRRSTNMSDSNKGSQKPQRKAGGKNNSKPTKRRVRKVVINEPQIKRVPKSAAKASSTTPKPQGVTRRRRHAANDVEPEVGQSRPKQEKQTQKQAPKQGRQQKPQNPADPKPKKMRRSHVDKRRKGQEDRPSQPRPSHKVRRRPGDKGAVAQVSQSEASDAKPSQNKPRRKPRRRTKRTTAPKPQKNQE